jgi:Reverse transcriptase (RNA-dependent DNA polymerase)
VEPILDCKIYLLGPGEQDKLDVFLEENLSSRRIRPSQSKVASPFFFIKKKDGRLRPVQDYRKLNKMMIKNHYPLPLTHELIDRVKGSKFFTKLDICWGYNNIRIKEGYKWKAAFKTNYDMFKPLVIFFGLTNSLATFQTMMNNIFWDLIN